MITGLLLARKTKAKGHTVYNKQLINLKSSVFMGNSSTSSLLFWSHSQYGKTSV